MANLTIRRNRRRADAGPAEEAGTAAKAHRGEGRRQAQVLAPVIPCVSWNPGLGKGRVQTPTERKIALSRKKP